MSRTAAACPSQALSPSQLPLPCPERSGREPEALAEGRAVGKLLPPSTLLAGRGRRISPPDLPSRSQLCNSPSWHRGMKSTYLVLSISGLFLQSTPKACQGKQFHPILQMGKLRLN